MRRICMIALVFGLAAGLAAQESGPNPRQWSAGITTGIVVDLAGYGLAVAGTAVGMIDTDLTLPLLGAGTLVMTAGGLVTTIFLGQMAEAYMGAGIALEGDPGPTSWTLTWVSVGCTAAAALTGITQFAGDATPWIALAFLGGALIAESVNLFSVRSDWMNKLEKARAEKFGAALIVTPTLVLAPGSSAGTLEPGITFCLAY